MSKNLQEFVSTEYGVDVSGFDMPDGMTFRDIVRWADQCIVAKNNKIAALENALSLATKVYDDTKEDN